MTNESHDWRFAPPESKAHWKCKKCGKLDYNAIPDVAEVCEPDPRPTWTAAEILEREA